MSGSAPGRAEERGAAVAGKQRMLEVRERGAAVADFAMTSGLLTLLFVVVLQLGFALHIRNTLTSCASEGARVGARLGSGPAAGAQRTREVIAESLRPSYAEDVSAHQGTVGGTAIVVVTVVAPLPMFGPFGPGKALTVTGRAYEEGQ
ncbi:MAG: TadE/TadG family type IV pilus assembly protein [Nostocoides sp.]